jgi:hypothetical protein
MFNCVGMTKVNFVSGMREGKNSQKVYDFRWSCLFSVLIIVGFNDFLTAWLKVNNWKDVVISCFQVHTLEFAWRALGKS